MSSFGCGGRCSINVGELKRALSAGVEISKKIIFEGVGKSISGYFIRYRAKYSFNKY